MSGLMRAMRWRLLCWQRERSRLRALGRPLVGEPSADPTVAIVRVVGNDLWPRHADGQALENLGFILQHEPAFAGCRKLFVLNRIVDDRLRLRAEAMVEAAGHACLTLPFSAADYAALRMDTSYFGGDAHFLDADFARKSGFVQGIERLWAAAPKVRYVMNVNAARNAALDWGKERCDWTFVLDGSCFLTEAIWRSLKHDLSAPPFAPYLVLPLQRLTDNRHALSIPPDPSLSEEPQLAFHKSAEGRFDPVFPYGMRDKTALLDRIGVPGAWNFWVRMPWLPQDQPVLADRHRWKRASAPVLRLSSGVSGGALEGKGAQSARYQSRTDAIFRTLALLDQRLGTADRDRAKAILGLDRDDV